LVSVGVGASGGAVAAQALVAAGYRTIKIKRAVGARGSSVGDGLRAVRDAVGPGVALRLDLNGDLSERAAIAWLCSLDELDLEYVEQPIATSLGADAMARVRDAIPMPLAADESVTDVDAARALLDTGAADVLVVKPSRVGGPRASMRIARAAAAVGVAVTVSTLYDSGVGLAAALHVAASLSDDRAHGLGTAALLESDLIGGGLPIIEGRMAVPDGAGLGVTLDATALAGEPVRS
jgi:L-alanine-DL-glutamate epimerase-like enolase superfamily enzyme